MVYGAGVWCMVQEHVRRGLYFSRFGGQVTSGDITVYSSSHSLLSLVVLHLSVTYYQVVSYFMADVAARA